jgi:bifunctional non-homologous end joining protein LigD
MPEGGPTGHDVELHPALVLVRLLTRNGSDFTKRFPLVVAATAALPVRFGLIEGETIVSDDSGLAVFDLIRSWPTSLSAVLCTFDLLELDPASGWLYSNCLR